jgi:glycosyltransferase involved in cell wall biosynthesis
MTDSLSQITPLILTYNEAPNIARTLEALHWATQVLVIDSFSVDHTLEIVRTFPNVRVLQRKFDSFAGQCNFGLEQIETEWVLSLDADYVLTPEFVAELCARDLTTSPEKGYAAHFRYCVYGYPLRGTLYPPRTVLYCKSQARYLDDGHAHRVQIDGSIGQLHSFIDHDDRKSLSRWLSSQDKYMVLEVQKLLNTPPQLLSRTDRIRRCKIGAPLLALLYCLFWKRLILDGWPGWYYTLQRVLAETLLSLRLIETEQLGAKIFSQERK